MKPWSMGFWDKTTEKPEPYFHCGPGVRVSVRVCLWLLAVVCQTGLGWTTGVEITLLFAWATAVICFDELYKSRTARGGRIGGKIERAMTTNGEVIGRRRRRGGRRRREFGRTKLIDA